MLIIRLRRIGKKNNPSYRVVVAEHSFPVNGKFTADLGFYNPHTKLTGLKLDEIKSWLDKGAQPSNTVARLLEKEKLKHKSVVVIKKKKQPKKAEEVKPAAAAPAPKAEEAAETSETTEEKTETAVEETAPEAEADNSPAGEEESVPDESAKAEA